MDETGLLLAHMEDLARQAQREGAAFSRFLTPAQARTVADAFARRREVGLSFDGGFEGAERTLAVFTAPQWGEHRREAALAALALDYRRQDSLSHRDVLGALMALGIRREVIGDIEAGGNPIFLVCMADMAEYIARSLTQAGRVGLSAGRIPLDALPEKRARLREIRDTVASPRLDAMLATAFSLPRPEAVRAIRAGLVSLNHRDCLDIAKQVLEGDLLALRGRGRARVLSVGGRSRKGRVWVTIGVYI